MKFIKIFGFTLLFFSCKITQKVFHKKIQITQTKVITIDKSTNPFSGLSEPSICINKTDTTNFVAGSIYNNVYTTNNGGNTWQTAHLKSKLGVFGDPCLASDRFGHIYYLHLSNPENDRNSPEFLSSIVIQTSIDKGKTWTDGTAIGYNKLHDQDKHWIGIHPLTGELAVTWTEFDHYGSKKPTDHSRILFSKSKDFGQTWTQPIQINDQEGDCLDSDNTVEGAVSAFDKNGNIYVVWAYNNRLWFDKSSDNGHTWLKNDLVIAQQPQGWDYDIPGVFRANGMPVLDIDHSKGPYEGTIYVNWSDQRNGIDNTDIFIIKSRDGGKTWSSPKKVNTDKTKTHQYLTWMKVDPATGYIYIVFYDRHNFTDNRTEVSLAYSTDGGENFKQLIISDQAFTPHKQIFAGDYNNIDAFQGIVTPIWTDISKNVLSIKSRILHFK